MRTCRHVQIHQKPLCDTGHFFQQRRNAQRKRRDCDQLGASILTLYINASERQSVIFSVLRELTQIGRSRVGTYIEYHISTYRPQVDLFKDKHVISQKG